MQLITARSLRPLSRICGPLVLFALVWCSALGATAQDTFWTTGYALHAGRGTFPNGSTYGNTRPLDPKGSAWTSGGGTHVLTWVAAVPSSATYHVWVRRYMGYGMFAVSADEVATSPLVNPRYQFASTAEYGWAELGTLALNAGAHHLDVVIREFGMLDALLLTSDPSFVPQVDGSNLPPRVLSPQLREPRRYRVNEQALVGYAGNRGYVVARLPAKYPEPYEAANNDHLPTTADVITTELTLSGARDQYASTTFVVRALSAANTLLVGTSDLQGPGGVRLDARHIDLKVVGLLPRVLGAFREVSAGEVPPTPQLWPELLLRDDRNTGRPRGVQGGFGSTGCTTSLAAHESRQFWLTVHIPSDAPPGKYTGSIDFLVPGEPSRGLTLNIALDVRPMRLAPVEGNYGFFLSQDWTSANVGEARMRQVFEDHARHGLNSVTLHAADATLDTDLELAAAAGLRGYAVPMRPSTSYPDAEQRSQDAQELGFRDLVYWAMDEPQCQTCDEPQCRPFCVDAACTRCNKSVREAIERVVDGRNKNVRSMISINRSDYADSLRDYPEFPLFSLAPWSFNPTTAEGLNGYAASARERGFVPATYYMAWPSDALYHRSFAGLFNTRLGYQGSVPWYYGGADWQTAYDPATGEGMGVVYPDENGAPISSIRWEALRDGVDDVRYLQELDRLLAAGRARQANGSAPASLGSLLAEAEQVRQLHFVQNVKGRYFDYLNGVTSELEQARAAFTGAIERLTRPMALDVQATVPNEVSAGKLDCVDLHAYAPTYTAVSGPNRGTLVLTDANTGDYRYSVTNGATGADSFRFQCRTDAVVSAEAAISMTLVDTRSSLQSRWKLDGNAVDSAPFGQATNGTASSTSATYEALDKRVGARALSLPGNGAHVRIANATELNPREAFTWALWLKLDDAASGRRALQKGTNGAQYRLYYDANQLKFEARIGGALRIASSPSLVIGSWAHVAVTYDGAALKLYVNGAPSTTTPASGTVSTTSSPLFLGTRTAGAPSSESWRGKLDDVRLYVGRALTQAELQALAKVID